MMVVVNSLYFFFQLVEPPRPLTRSLRRPCASLRGPCFKHKGARRGGNRTLQPLPEPRGSQYSCQKPHASQYLSFSLARPLTRRLARTLRELARLQFLKITCAKPYANLARLQFLLTRAFCQKIKGQT